MTQAQPLTEHERLGDRDLRDAEDHVVADLGGLAEARAAAVHDPAPHRLQERAGRLEVLVGATDHEGERGVLGADHATRDRRIDAAVTGGLGERVRLARLVDRDRRGVDEERSGCRHRKQSVRVRRSAVRVDHVPAAGEHRENDLGRFRGVLARVRHRDAGRARGVDRRGDHVEAGDLMPGLHQVQRHRQPHVAETEERDLHRTAPSSSRPMITRMISFVPSRI